MSLQVVSRRQPYEIEAIKPEVARNTTEIEYVLVPRTQL